MSEVEKEYRYKIDDNIVENIKRIATVIEEEQNQVDLTLGYAGFESLYKYGYVCRVRRKGKKIWLEIKNRQEDGSFIETKIYINDFSDGVKLFQAIGMKPYMYMERKREILKYNNLKIFIDDVELLGKYVEIEFQDEQNKENIENFTKMVNIDSEKQPLYGDIIINKIKEDESFNKEYNRRLNEFINF